MLSCILIGLLLVIVTVGIHGVGTAWMIRRMIGSDILTLHKPDSFAAIWLLCSTAAKLMLLHVVEVAVWAIAYLVILDVDEASTIEEAIYFSMVTFASLGYGDVVIAEGPWRLLSGIQAMTGLLVFGWSTALLFTVVRSLWESERN